MENRMQIFQNEEFGRIRTAPLYVGLNSPYFLVFA